MQDQVIPSITRAKAFFGMNPLEFVDDVVTSVSTYVQETLEALFAKLLEVKTSQNHKYKFERDIREAMQESININSDLFELYVMRNIFHIDVDVDLTDALTRSENSTIGDEVSADRVDLSFGYDDSEGLDGQLEELYKQIQMEQSKRRFLASEIRRNQVQVKIAEMIMERLPAIRELATSVVELPIDEIDRIIAQCQELLERVRSVPPEKDPMKSLAFHQNTFIFD